MQLTLVDSRSACSLSSLSSSAYLRFEGRVRQQVRVMNGLRYPGDVYITLPVGENEKWAVATADIFRTVESKYQVDIEVGIRLKCRIHGKITVDIASLKGRKIDSSNYICTGTINSSTLEPLQKKQIAEIFMEVVVDIPEKPKIEPECDDSDSDSDSDTSIEEPEQSIGNGIPVGRKVLEDELFSDASIYVGNGAEIKAHKCFPSACSPVLKKMFENKMKESKTGKVEMPDVSEQGVRAFLRYLYYGDLKEPMDDVKIAFELLSAAHKYDVGSLETKMASCLMKMLNEDLSVELIFKIYMFIKNIDSAAELKAQTIKFLKTKMDELESLAEYQELFRTNPNAAMKVAKDFAKTSSV